MRQDHVETVRDEWVSFPGGELEGRRPKVLCSTCRAALAREATHPAPRSAHPAPRTLCFQCYRAELDRERALRAAGQLNTASEERFQSQLPFEPVDRPRLEMLKADRAQARAAAVLGTGRFVDKRRQAQIAARHALQRVAAGIRTRQVGTVECERVIVDAIHAAELQLPDAWLPFVVSR